MADPNEGHPEEGTLLRPQTISERVLQELRVLFAQGRFAPGERVKIDRLAAEFGVSPLSVREATRVLLAEGRVSYTPHRGYRVAKLTLGDVEEIFLMCGLLESEALRRGVPKLDAGAVERMRSLMQRLEKRSDEPLWERIAVHQDFHFVPIESAGLPRLAQELRRLWDHTDHYRALYLFQDSVVQKRFQAEHRQLLEACEKRDAERTVEIMNEHRAQAIRQMASGFMDASDDPPPTPSSIGRRRAKPRKGRS
jgi:DNA-binding GntR family transcriptional regulator